MFRLGARVLSYRDGSIAPVAALVLLCAFLLAGTWLFVAGNIAADRNAVARDQARDLDHLARAVEAQTTGALNQADQIVKLLQAAAAAALRSGRDRLAPGAIVLPTDASVLEAFWADSGGDVVWSSAPRAQPAKVADQEYFRFHKASASAGASVSKRLVLRATGKSSIVVARRVNRPDGGFGGVVAVAVDAQSLARLYGSDEVGAKGLVLLLGKDGGVRASSLPASRAGTIADVHGTQLLERVERRREGFFTSTDIDGVARFWTAHPLAAFPDLAVAVGRGQDEAYAENVARQRRSIFGAAAVSALLVASCFYVSMMFLRRQEALAKLRESDERLRLAVDGSGAGLWELDIASHSYWLSPRLRRILGIEGSGALTQEEFIEVVHPDDRALLAEAMARHLRDGQPYDLEFRVLRPEGGVRWMRSFGEAQRNAQGEPFRFAGTVHDVTVRKNMEQEAREAVADINAVLEAADVGIALLRGSTIVRCNQYLASLLLYSESELVGTDVSRLYARTRRSDIQEPSTAFGARGGASGSDVQLRRKDGEIRWVQERVRAIAGEGREPGAVWVVHDVTERKRLEAGLARLAHHDSLTGLVNRTRFRARVGEALANIGESGGVTGILFLDLDQFKVVNDVLGHTAGDDLLCQVASRLRDTLRDTDTVARLGGDEFGVLLPSLANSAEAMRVAEKILHSMEASFMAGGEELHVTTSVGIAVAPRNGTTVDEVIRNADVAMYRAKAAGRNTIQIYDAPVARADVETGHPAGPSRLALQNALHRALERGEFCLHYQPRIDVRTGRVTGVEALLRWRQRDGALTLPKEFVPILEESGLIVPVGAWAVEEALRQAAAWRDQGVRPLLVAVNVAARQFATPELLDAVERGLARSGIDADRFELEVTEGSLMREAEHTTRMLGSLQRLGVRVAIDDFGTGYSSLAYLKRFALDSVKIDSVFVRGLPDDPSDVSIVSAIIAMAHSLGIRVIAEGVETEGQRRVLDRRGCHEYQGALFSMPVEPDAIPEMIAESDRA